MKYTITLRDTRDGYTKDYVDDYDWTNPKDYGKYDQADPRYGSGEDSMRFQ